MCMLLCLVIQLCPTLWDLMDYSLPVFCPWGFSSQEWYKKHTDWNCPSWPDTTVNICISYFTTEGPGKEHRTNKPPPTGRVWERSKGDTMCPTTSQNPSCWHPSWLSNECATLKDSESEWLAKDNLETNPITIKPTASHVAEQFSWVPLPYCSLPRHPFPIKSLALSTHVSPLTIHLSIRPESTFWPW